MFLSLSFLCACELKPVSELILQQFALCGMCEHVQMGTHVYSAFAGVFYNQLCDGVFRNLTCLLFLILLSKATVPHVFPIPSLSLDSWVNSMIILYSPFQINTPARLPGMYLNIPIFFPPPIF